MANLRTWAITAAVGVAAGAILAFFGASLLWVFLGACAAAGVTNGLLVKT